MRSQWIRAAIPNVQDRLQDYGASVGARPPMVGLPPARFLLMFRSKGRDPSAQSWLCFGFVFGCFSHGFVDSKCLVGFVFGVFYGGRGAL